MDEWKEGETTQRVGGLSAKSGVPKQLFLERLIINSILNKLILIEILGLLNLTIPHLTSLTIIHLTGQFRVTLKIQNSHFLQFGALSSALDISSNSTGLRLRVPNQENQIGKKISPEFF